MATTTQDDIYKTFLEVSGEQASALSDAAMTLTGVLAQVQEVATAGGKAATPTPAGVTLADVQAQVQEIQAAGGLATAAASGTPAAGGAAAPATMTLTDVLEQVQEIRAAIPAPNVKTPSTSAYPAQSSSGGDTLSSVASTVLKSGFGLAPLVSGLIGLFGGGDTTAPAPLVKYALPAAVDFQTAESGGGTTGLDYDQSGMPRIYRADAGGSSQTAPTSGADNSRGGGAAAPQITVHVQAMDARSFMDRSNEIALAVRDAMLNMNAINDVVNEL